MFKSLVAAVITVFALTAAAARADADAEHCTLESLHGTLAYYYLTGAPIQTPVLPLAQIAMSGSGMEYYDGKGGMKYYELTSDGDHSYTYAGAGTYTITANCIATVTYSYEGVQSGSPWTYIVAPDGSGYYWNNNQNRGALSAGQANRISRADLVP